MPLHLWPILQPTLNQNDGRRIPLCMTYFKSGFIREKEALYIKEKSSKWKLIQLIYIMHCVKEILNNVQPRF